ncbi:hypothetical protein QQF64_035984 [Cirrhinus molitorella]|uniref:Uncharacterized protein n=1 Tax=Cirrhinus molitorella TaxID=172907 RepID=A0ABR3NHT6_9TELE
MEMAGIEACVISRGMLTVVTAPEAEERKGKRRGMAGIEACVVSGGMLMLGTASGAEEREEIEGVKLASSAEACSC